MPKQKDNTTLVTEDELVEAVSIRVTGQIRKDMDERFGRMEQIIENLAPPKEVSPRRSSNRIRKRTEENEAPEQPAQKAPRHAITISDTDQSHSSFGTYSGPGSDFPLQQPHAIDNAARRAHAPPTQDSRTSSGVNINNNTSTWGTWLGAQQPFNSQATAAPGRSGFDTPLTPADIDAQVRQIMDTTPHQLKGTVPVGIYPFKHVTRGPGKRKLSFNMVTLAEHIYGMFRILDDVNTSPAIKPDIVTHMREVAEDAAEFEWNGYVRRWSEEVFYQIAENRLPGGWAATSRIQNLRTGMSRVDAARLTFPKEPVGGKKSSSFTHQSDVLRGGPPCTAFNAPQGCPLQSGHTLSGKKQIHVCSYCLVNNAAVHPHSESQCRNKQRHTASHFQ